MEYYCHCNAISVSCALDWQYIDTRTLAFFTFTFYKSSCGAGRHSLLIHKLKMYGICGSLLQWIGSFLTGRCHRTKVGNILSVSDVEYIISGVIQGSCLGPILFLLYINDLPDVFDDDT